jgi:hypothetical protein
MLKDVREYALPLAADIPPLERRLRLLAQQTELSELEATMRTGSAEEKLQVYVLPQNDDMQRTLAFLESVRTFLERRNLLARMSPLSVGEPSDTDGGLKARELRFSATLRPEGRAQLLSILELSGLITVGDTLSPKQISDLFALTEKHNYAGIVPVEQFLSADLLAYVQDPRLHDDRLAQALSSEEFLAEVKTLLQQSLLPGARELLQSEAGRTIIAQKLWPAQFMTIESEVVRVLPDGREELDLTLKVYSRKWD